MEAKDNRKKERNNSSSRRKHLWIASSAPKHQHLSSARDPASRTGSLDTGESISLGGASDRGSWGVDEREGGTDQAACASSNNELATDALGESTIYTGVLSG
jgi:hypothetical protein